MIKGLLNSILLSILALALIACNSEKAKEETVSSFTFLSSQADALSVLSGGAYFYARQLGTGRVLSQYVYGEDLVMELDNGQWEFVVIGWKGTSALKGEMRCAKQSVSLNGGTLALFMNLNRSNCKDFGVFSGTTAMKDSTSGQPKPLEIYSCNTVPVAAAEATAGCDGVNLGPAQSYKIFLNEYDADEFSVQTGNHWPVKDSVVCIDHAYQLQGSTKTAHRLPIGVTDSKVLFNISIETFPTPGCSGAILDRYDFPGGIRSKPYYGPDKVSFFAGTTHNKLFLGPSIKVIKPVVMDVTIAVNDGLYGVGDTIPIDINFSEPVGLASGIPKLTLSNGIELSSGYLLDTDTYRFDYVVTASDPQGKVDYSTKTAFSGGVFKNSSGEDALIDLPDPTTALSLYFNNVVINHPPNISAFPPNTVAATVGTAETITFSINDLEAVQCNTSVSISVNGISGSFSAITGTQNCSVDFTPSSSGAGSITISANDGNTLHNISTVNIAINATSSNTAPTLHTGFPMNSTNVLEDTTNPAGDLLSAIIATSTANTSDIFEDPDAGAVEGIAVVSAPSANGNWQFSLDNGTTWTTIPNTVTSSNAALIPDTVNSKIRFVPNPNYNGTVSLGVHAWDTTQGAPGQLGFDMATNGKGGSTAFSNNSESINLTVTNKNDAPVLSNATPMSFSVNEDETAPVGTLVSAIISSPGGDPITDIDPGAVEGLAIIGATNVNGTWEYSIDAGSTWLALGSPTSATARVLLFNNKIRYIPNTNVSGSSVDSLTARAWDNATGTPGDQVNIGGTGAATNYSTNTINVNINVTAINDAPVLSGTQSLTINRNDTAIALASASLNATDVDNTNTNVLFKIKTLPSNGVTIKKLGTSMSVNDTFHLDNITSGDITFDHDGSNLASSSFTFALADSGGLEAAGAEDATPATFNITIVQPDLGTSIITGTSTLNSGNTITLTLQTKNGTAANLTFGGDVVTFSHSGGTSTGTFANGGVATDNGDGTYSINFTAVNSGTATSAEAIITGLGTVGNAYSVTVNPGTIHPGNSTLTPSATSVVSTSSITLTVQAKDAAGNNLTTGGDTITFTNAGGTSTGTFSAVTDNTDGTYSVTFTGANVGTPTTITASLPGPTNLTDTADITVIASNNAPVLSTNSGTTMDEGATGVVISNAKLLATDTEDANTAITFVLESLPTNGISIKNNGTVLGVSDTFTQADIDNSFIELDHDGSEFLSASFTFSVKDSAAAEAAGATSGTPASYSIVLNPMNDAPILDNSETMVLNSINEDDGTNTGTTVADIINSSAANGNNAISDDDSSAVEGIAVVGFTDNGNGTWQWDNGGGWTSFAGLAPATATLLEAADSIRYIPNTDFNGSQGSPGTISFHAWDTTTGSSGMTGVDTTSNGGTTAFSTDLEEATIPILPENDAPNLTIIGASMTDIERTDTATSGTLISTLVGTTNDVDTSDTIGIVITAVDNTDGKWQWSSDDVNWNDLTGVSPASAIPLPLNYYIRFDTTGNEVTTTTTFDFKAWDGSDSAAVGASIDYSAGFTADSPYSSNTDTVTLNVVDTIAPVDPSPILASHNPGLFAEPTNTFSVDWGSNTDATSLWYTTDGATNPVCGVTGSSVAGQTGTINIDITGKTDGAAYELRIVACDDAGNQSNVINVQYKYIEPPMSVYYDGYRSWNTWVAEGSSSAAPTTCNTNDVANSKCIHAGMARRISLPYAEIADCTGISVSDNLGIFHWECEDSGGAGNVYLHNKKGFQPGKGLKDLLNPAGTGWENTLDVDIFGHAAFNTQNPIASDIATSGATWNNTVVALTGIATTDNPNVADEVILTYNANLTFDNTLVIDKHNVTLINIGADGLALTADNTFGGDSTACGWDYYGNQTGASCLVNVSGNYFWLENTTFNGYDTGSIHTVDYGLALAPQNPDGTGFIPYRAHLVKNKIETFAKTGVVLYQGGGHKFDDTKILNIHNASDYVGTPGFGEGLRLDLSDSNIFIRTLVSKNIQGLLLIGAQDNKFFDTHVILSYQDGILLAKDNATSVRSDGNVFQDTRVTSTWKISTAYQGNAIRLYEADNNTFVNSYLINNNQGLFLEDAHYNIFMNSMITNSDASNSTYGGGIALGSSASPATYNSFYHSTIVRANVALRFEHASTQFNKFVNVATQEITTRTLRWDTGSGANNNTFSGKLLHNGSLNCSNSTLGAACESSGFIVAAGYDLKTTLAFVGIGANTPWATFALNPLSLVPTNHHQTVSSYDDGNTLGNTNRCYNGTCAIYDFQLKSGADPLNYFGAGFQSAQNNEAFHTWLDGSKTHFHTLAYEVSPNLDLTGVNNLDISTDNFNGLCESTENCVGIKNFSIYQGHAGLVEDNSTFANGVNVGNVQLIKYNTNGVP